MTTTKPNSNAPSVCIISPCRFLLKGIHDSIKEEWPQGPVVALEHEEAIQSLRNRVKHDIILMDERSNPEYLLKELNLSNADLRVLLLIEQFDFTKYKKLFLKGVHGIVSKFSTSEILVEALTVTLNGDRFIDQKFHSFILKSYCSPAQINGKERCHNGRSRISSDGFAVAQQLYDITEREYQVLELVFNGLTTHRIADELCISRHTAETHRKHLLEKLNANNSIELIRIALEKNILSIS